MKSIITRSLLCLTFLPLVAFAQATQKDAVAMVEKGLAYMKSNGQEALMKRINDKDPEFVQGELYLYMRDVNSGKTIAHPINPALIGKDLIDVPDADGKAYRREIVELAKSKGKGWVDYKFKNPASGKVEPKSTYFVRSGDVTLEAGIYKK